MAPPRSRRPPLIGDDTLDTEVQRQALLGLFVLVQAWKVYDLVLLNVSGSASWGFVAKYVVLDSALILAVPVLSLPQLPLSFGLAFVLATVVNALTFSLTSNFAILGGMLPLIMPKEKELEIMEKYVDPELDQSSHFKGKKKLRMAPDSSIKLNPFNEQLCIKPVYDSVARVPFLLDSMNGLSFLQLTHVDINNNMSILNYTYFGAGSVIGLDQPGFYSIYSALDTNGKSIKPMRSTTFIPVCPEASFVPMDLSPKCQSEKVGLEVQLYGVPPFTLLVQEEVNGKLSNVEPITAVVPNENFQSPLSEKRDFIKSDVSDLAWMRSRSVVVPIKTPDRTGDFVYTIAKVVDGFGNEVVYKPDFENRDILVNFSIVKNPVFELTDPNPNIPILLGRKKVLAVKDYDCGAHDFNVVVSYQPSGNDKSTNLETFARTFQPGAVNYLEIEKPGVYSITSGQCSGCSAKSLGKSVTVNDAKLPNIDIGLEQIVDTCVGTTGFKFGFDFTGTPPFEIGYKISKLDPNDSARVLKIVNVSKLVSNEAHLDYDFNPTSEGSYSIEFLNLSDRYYKNQIKFIDGEHRYVTYFKQRPKLSLGTSQLNVCNSQAAQVEFLLDGKFPFSLKYALVSPDGQVQSFHEEDIQSSPFVFRTDDLAVGGVYKIQVVEAKDSSSCDVEYGVSETIVNVRSDIPRVSFENRQSHFTIVEGTTIDVPLDVQGSISLVYSHVSDSGVKEMYNVNHVSSSGLKLGKSGIYSLTSFSENGCPGEVDEGTISIEYLPKPYIRIDSIEETCTNGFQLDPVCQNTQDSVSVKLFGSAPFVVEFTVVKPNGDMETNIAHADDNLLTIPMESSMSGNYKYVFDAIYDSLYTEHIVNYLREQGLYRMEPLVILQTVSATPSGYFLNSDGTDYDTCVMFSRGVKSIEMQLDGQGPLDITLDIHHQEANTHKTVTLTGLDAGVVNLDSIYGPLPVGNHVIGISQIVDAHGCSMDPKEVGETITVKVNDLPNAIHLTDESSQVEDENYYCVGDHISYSLVGTPPFLITYEFNHETQKSVEVPLNIFKRRAPGPGLLHINALKDSIGCEIAFGPQREDLTAHVYDLPSVEIIQGESVEVDLYEGENVEITFLLTGIPPFALTYVRLDLNDESKIVETESVEGITDNEFRIVASMEGTYEAVVVQDKHCLAKNPKFF